MRGEHADLAALAEAVADGQVIDWASVESSAETPEERALVRQLRLLAGVAGVHRSATATYNESVEPALIAPGATWGPLEVRQPIGGGSFGVVYRAWDPRLARDVALKLLQREPGDAQASTIIEEGRMLARIRHPHVITVFGASRFDGRVGIWMEYIRGRTLEQVITEDGTLGAREAALVGTALCSALAAVHQQGVVHRDIKAHNVMREEGGRIVLMDFGAGEDPAAPVRAARIAGTPLYMAPELFTGGRATPASDLYSLGVLLFRLVTGQYPVTGASVEEVRAAHARSAPVRLRDLRPDLPSGFIKSVERALAPEPADRIESAGAFEAALSTDVLSDTSRSGEIAPQARRRVSPWWSIAAVAVTIAVAAGVWSWRSRTAGAIVTPRTIAVRAFQNQTGDPAQQYFASGLSDVLLAQLGALGGLRVVAVSDPPAGQPVPTIEATAGRFPKAYALLDGSVQRSGGKVRVSARLVELASSSLLWGRSYDGNDAEAFALQAQIAASLARHLNVAVTPSEEKRLARPGPSSVEAQDAYLLGRYQLHLAGRQNLPLAQEAFERVLRMQPGYAPALSGLARTYLAMGNVGLLTPARVRELAPPAAREAYALDATLPEAALAMADVSFRLEWNWQHAETGYRSAIALNPSSIDARTWYARYLAAAGRPADGLREAQDAAQIDPLSDDVDNVIGLMLFYDRQYPQAIAHFRRRLADQVLRGRIGLARSYAANRQFAEAIAMITSAIAISDDPALRAERARIVAASGDVTGARQLLAELDARRAVAADYIAPQDLAYIHLALGDTDRGLSLLDDAIAEHASRLLWLGVDPRVDRVRTDPRFISIVRRLGIPSTR